MTHDLIISLSDQAWTALHHQSASTGKPPQHIVATMVEQQLAMTNTMNPVIADKERRAEELSFERHFGAVSVPDPTGLENDAIDADLAREYGSTHEAR